MDSGTKIVGVDIRRARQRYSRERRGTLTDRGLDQRAERWAEDRTRENHHPAATAAAAAATRPQSIPICFSNSPTVVLRQTTSEQRAKDTRSV